MLRVAKCCAKTPLKAAAIMAATFCMLASEDETLPRTKFGTSADRYVFRDMSKQQLAEPPTTLIAKSISTDCAPNESNAVQTRTPRERQAAVV
mmetsp:Transcript_13529/g.28245  ORF Transcript_13529/g.28245 Transcript_13529/m.28245 type:complete len:93 (-) Transcript_13529:251-529(-)